MEKFIDFQKGLYIGNVENSLSSYIGALTEVMNAYGKPYSYRDWVASDDWNGSFRTIEVTSLENFDLIAYVNRAFNFPELKHSKELSYYYDYLPNGGKFHISQYIERLKTDL